MSAGMQTPYGAGMRTVSESAIVEGNIGSARMDGQAVGDATDQRYARRILENHAGLRGKTARINPRAVRQLLPRIFGKIRG